jgi:hypothetical protein
MEDNCVGRRRGSFTLTARINFKQSFENKTCVRKRQAVGLTRRRRAGLELVAAVGGLKTHASLQTRVGIATGLVVVGDLIGSGASQEQAIVGETPNLAARIQGIASPNAVVICEPTMSRRGIAFDYSSPAELYLSRRRGRHTDYRRFATAAAAIHYAVEELRALRSLTAWTGPSGSDRQSPCMLQSPPSRIDIDGLA